jgi:hypothetical protein
LHCRVVVSLLYCELLQLQTPFFYEPSLLLSCVIDASTSIQYPQDISSIYEARYSFLKDVKYSQLRPRDNLAMKMLPRRDLAFSQLIHSTSDSTRIDNVAQ